MMFVYFYTSVLLRDSHELEEKNRIASFTVLK